MKQIWITIAALALILLALGEWRAWQTRDASLQAAITAARIDGCAQIAASSADFRNWARQGRREVRNGGASGLRQDTRALLQDKLIELIRAIEVGQYILPDDIFSADLAELADATVKMQPALAQGEWDRADNLLVDFDRSASAIQDACANLIDRTPFAQG